MNWGKYGMQLIFGLPVLLWTLTMVYLDTSGRIDVEKFGYAFFGGIIYHFIQYFFRKSPPEVTPPTGVNGSVGEALPPSTPTPP